MALDDPYSQLRLYRNEVHVWHARLDVRTAAVEKLGAQISAEERARAARFAFPIDRDRFIVARGVLRELLGAYLHQSPTNVCIETSPHGKPALRRALGVPDLRFNLSHSEDLALYAFTLGRDIGIDVEKIQPKFAAEDISEQYFSVQERHELRAMPSELRTEAFFLCWTRKEAYLKARGKGLGTPLDSFTVSFKPNEPAVLTSMDSSRWILHSLRPQSDFVGALVVEGPPARLCISEWENHGH